MTVMLIKKFLMGLGPSSFFSHFVLRDKAAAMLQQHVQNLGLAQKWVLQEGDMEKGVIVAHYVI